MAELPTVFVTDHAFSRRIGKAFAEGAGLRIEPVEAFDEEAPVPAVVYGILRGCDRVIRACRSAGVDYWHIDHGYFRRGHPNGYFRVTKNARLFQWEGRREYSPDRWEKLKLEISPWVNYQAREFMLFLPPTVPQAALDDWTPLGWTRAVIEPVVTAQQHAIMIKPKLAGPIEPYLERSMGVIAFNSMVVIEAIAAGIPAVATTQLVTREMRPDDDLRAPFFHALAYQQFTLEEMVFGTAWKALNEAA